MPTLNVGAGAGKVCCSLSSDMSKLSSPVGERAFAVGFSSDVEVVEGVKVRQLLGASSCEL